MVESLNPAGAFGLIEAVATWSGEGDTYSLPLVGEGWTRTAVIEYVLHYGIPCDVDSIVIEPCVPLTEGAWASCVEGLCDEDLRESTSWGLRS